MPLASERHRFDIPDDVTYLNSAYMSPLSHAAIAAGEAGLGAKRRPWTITAPDFFENADTLRGLVAGLLGATARDVALVPAASYGIAVAAANLPLAAGQRVLLLDEAFPSMVYAWRERAREVGATIETVPRPADDDWTRAVLERIDERTAVASLPHCHWTDGSRLDLAAIGARLREVGAALVVDATQSLGALPFDVGAIQPDFVTAAAYKWLLGPYSLGYLYAAPARQQGRPIEHGWMTREGAEDFAGLTRYRDALAGGAKRYDVGEFSNFALLPVAIAALGEIHAWGVPAIQETLSGLTAAVAERAASIGLRAVAADRRAGHFIGLRASRPLPPDLVARLAAERVYVSVRGPAVRVAPHLYNHMGDVDRLIEVLARTLG
ncbi:MAG: aminotransferase class V-fold PLP-dependent enzyme [Vicinamibacterales bacterium]